MGALTSDLGDAAWDVSEWISAADAPVVEGKVRTSENCRAADGSSWFVSEPVNEQKVVSARWMTAGLGVYDLYVNGKLVGEDDVTEVDLDNVQDWDFLLDNNKDYETLKKNVLEIVEQLN